MSGPAELGLPDDRLVQPGVLLGQPRVKFAHAQRPIAVAVELSLRNLAVEIEHRGRDLLGRLGGTITGQAREDGKVVNVVGRMRFRIDLGENAFAKTLVSMTQHPQRAGNLEIQWNVERWEQRRQPRCVWDGNVRLARRISLPDGADVFG